MLAEDETVGYRSYMNKLKEKNKKKKKAQDKIDKILADVSTYSTTCWKSPPLATKKSARIMPTVDI